MQTCIINITNICDKHCPGCFIEEKKSVMNLDDFKKIINKLPKLNTITLSGGEPFTNKNIFQMCKYIYEKKKIKPQIITAGYNVDLKKFQNYISRIFVSIKYPNIIDSEWKKNPKAFSLAVKNLEQCNKLKIPIAINHCVDSLNVRNLGNMIQFAKQYNCEIHLLKFLPYKDETKKIYLNRRIWEEICRRVYNLQNVKIDYPSKYSYQECMAGINRMCIQTNGDVTSCIYDSFNVVGNILKESYKTIETKLYDLRYSFGNKKGCPMERILVKTISDKIKRLLFPVFVEPVGGGQY